MSRQAHAGYSGTPLHRKLGFKPGWRVGIVDVPDHYPDLLAGAEDVRFVSAASDGLDAVHVFLSEPGTIGTISAAAIARLRDGGMLWLSWAKKSSPLHAGITEEALRAAVLPLGWVDVKVCAVDADWSGLKFLRRRG